MGRSTTEWFAFDKLNNRNLKCSNHLASSDSYIIYCLKHFHCICGFTFMRIKNSIRNLLSVYLIHQYVYNVNYSALGYRWCFPQDCRSYCFSSTQLLPFSFCIEQKLVAAWLLRRTNSKISQYIVCKRFNKHCVCQCSNQPTCLENPHQLYLHFNAELHETSNGTNLYKHKPFRCVIAVQIKCKEIKWNLPIYTFWIRLLASYNFAL